MNGGKMGKQEELKTERKTTSGRKKKKPETWVEAGHGILILRDAVDRAVARQSEMLARALVSLTSRGNSTGTKLLVELCGADNLRTALSKPSTGRSLAELLGLDQEWKGPIPGAEDDRDEPDFHKAA